MKKKSILHKLKHYFSKEFRKQLKHEESLKGIIERLREKETELVEKLEETHKEEKRKQINKQLKVLRAQCQKAEKMIEENEPAGNTEDNP